MQLTIDLPQELAQRVEPERERLAEIIERGLQRRWSETSGAAGELITFIASGPSPRDIMAYRPSPAHVDRIGELLYRGKRGELSPAEQAELDEAEHLDYLVAFIKAEARRHVGQSA